MAKLIFLSVLVISSLFALGLTLECYTGEYQLGTALPHIRIWLDTKICDEMETCVTVETVGINPALGALIATYEKECTNTDKICEDRYAVQQRDYEYSVAAKTEIPIQYNYSCTYCNSDLCNMYGHGMVHPVFRRDYS